MLNMTSELKAKLLTAQSAEEAAALVKAAGLEITPEETARLWKEIQKIRKEEGRELSPDELDAVSGGNPAQDVNWYTHGCVSTVEPGSDCWNVDGGCFFTYYEYENMPNDHCPKCGAVCYSERSVNLIEGYNKTIIKCRNCGYSTHYHYFNSSRVG